MFISKQIVRRPLLIVIAAALCVACAGGPAPQRSPKHLRKSVYYNNRGADLLSQGCYVQALNFFNEAHQRYAIADNLEGVAQSLNSIADLYYRLGDMTSALLVYDDAIAVYREIADDTGLVRAMADKAATLIALDRLTEAARILDQADALDPEGAQKAMRLKNRALLYIRKKDFPVAKDLLARALASSDESQTAVRSSIYFAAGHIALMERRTEEARKAFTRALDIDRAATAYSLMARDLQNIGDCWVQDNDQARAVAYFKRSAKIYALLADSAKADEVTGQLKKSAGQAGIDIQATLHWIKLWLKEGRAVDLCD